MADGSTPHTILLVDDDPVVRTVAGRLLRRFRYAVVEADGGDEALRILRAGKTVDLLLTDVLMPGLNGWELCERVRAEFPDVRILVMSAFADDEAARRRVQLADTHFLPKPFGVESLTSAVETVLRSPRA